MQKNVALLICFLLSFAFLLGVTCGQRNQNGHGHGDNDNDDNDDGVIVDYRLCNGTNSERRPKARVQNVTLNPCATKTNEACDITAGGNATITVNFTPTDRVNSNTRHGIYWNTAVEMELRGLPKKACRKFVNCSAAAGIPRKYKALIPLKSSYPKRPYDVKVKLYAGKKTYFCVIVQVNLK